MRSLRPETRWRYVPKGWDPSCLWPNGRPPISPPDADEPQAAWIFPCPNPGCESELVILPEQAGFWVECPDCGLRFCCPRPASPEVVAKAKAMRPAPPQETKAAGALEALAKA
ncbi:MAG: IBR domain-containing protein, partial [Planctomycetes bacterium]|nr:IBR domain-containing protein [Planctomycetota bacterium]